MKIPLTQIAVIHRHRREIDLKHVQELAQSISVVGLLHPIVVRDPYPDELAEAGTAPYVLMCGGCRYMAHELLDLPEIEATHRRDLDPLHAELAELEENLRRRSIVFDDEAFAIERIVALRKLEDPSTNVTKVAKSLGVSARHVYDKLEVAKAVHEDPSLRETGSASAAKRTHARKKDVAQRLQNVQTQPRAIITERLVCADALDFAKTIPDHSVQLVFTDLPYAIDYFEVARGSENSAGKFDDDPDLCRAFISKLVPEAARIVKPSGWIVFFMCYEWHGWLQDLLRTAGPKPEMPPWIWARPGAGSFGHWPELHAANRFEMIVVANGGSATLAKKPVENVLLYPAPAAPRRHAHEKPFLLCRELIERCSLVGESVVDFCFGSGAGLAAAASLGRDFRGCDNNPENLDTAIAYVAEHFQSEAVLRVVK